MKPWLAVILAAVIAIAALTLWAARPGPVFTLTGLSYGRSCFYNTTKGNYSYWSVSFNITNRGASASAAVVISVDGTGILREYDSVSSGATAEVHRVVTDAAIPVDPACLAHNVTIGIGGYVF